MEELDFENLKEEKINIWIKIKITCLQPTKEVS